MSEEAKQWVAVTVWVFRGSQILSMRRASTQDAGPGLWEGVSGRVRTGEDPLSAAAREVVEETGLGVDLHPRPITAYAAKRRDEAMTVVVFRADHEAGEVTLSDEHDDYRWCALDDLSGLGVPPRLVEAASIAAAVVR